MDVAVPVVRVDQYGGAILRNPWASATMRKSALRGTMAGQNSGSGPERAPSPWVGKVSAKRIAHSGAEERAGEPIDPFGGEHREMPQAAIVPARERRCWRTLRREVASLACGDVRARQGGKASAAMIRSWW
jgi:hypothetical protein